MSAHYSIWSLNSYHATPYFESHLPPGYPTGQVLQKCRAFRRLPPNLRQLAANAKRWANRVLPGNWQGIAEWYDEQGYELNPTTGQRLTDAEIDAEWDTMALGLDNFQVKDIPLPAGGFPDPDTWEAPAEEEEEDEDRDKGPDEAQLLRDILSHGQEYTARYYGVSLDGITTDQELAEAIVQKRDG